MSLEPSIGDNRCQHHSSHAGARTDTDAPQKGELPACVHLGSEPHRYSEQCQCTQHHTSQPETVYQGGGKRANETERAMLIATATEMEALDQPNSLSRGTMSTPGVARIPAVTKSTMKVTAATTHA